MASIGNKLKQARVAAGMKQADVAAMLDCAPTSLTNWENDKVHPSLGVLSSLCSVYNISPLSLLSKNYDYAEVIAIAGKPIADRTYEEQIALNFSAPILEQLLAADAKRQEAAKTISREEFLRAMRLEDRFGDSLTDKETNSIIKEFASYGRADIDIQFAYHMLTSECKLAFLSMLCGLLSDLDNLQTFNDRMWVAAKFTIGNLINQRPKLKKM